MTHQEALQIDAVDSYLLDEMPARLRDEFEEHYFDCRLCAQDLSATTAFMDAARKELQRPLVVPARTAADLPASAPLPSIAPLPVQTAGKQPRWRNLALPLALAASLLVIVYQNVLVLPHFKTEVAELRAPSIVPVLSLAGANSRGASTPSLTLQHDQTFLLQFDIPADDRFSSYRCSLYSPSGSLLGVTEVSSAMARDTVTMSAVPVAGSSGHYRLEIQGVLPGRSPGDTAEVAHYAFDLSTRP